MNFLRSMFMVRTVIHITSQAGCGKLGPVPGDPDIRWKQRFQNFQKAFVLLHEALEHGPSELSLLEKEGVIQRFEYSFELAWKTVKDFLEDSGLVITPVTPRQVLKDAFAAKLITEGQVWIDMLDHRNLLSHSYDSAVFEEAVEAIAARYLPAMEQLRDLLLAKSSE
jgi:nucleotidyltransferase substrate binding protein (TIGR01987 family)